MLLIQQGNINISTRILKKKAIKTIIRGTKQNLVPIVKSALERTHTFWELLKTITYTNKIKQIHAETKEKYLNNSTTVCKVKKTDYEESLDLARNSILEAPFSGGTEHFMVILQILCDHCKIKKNETLCIEVCAEKKTILTSYLTHNDFHKSIDDLYAYLKDNQNNNLFDRDRMVKISVQDLQGNLKAQYAFPVNKRTGEILISEESLKDLKVLENLTKHLNEPMLIELAKAEADKKLKKFDLEEHEIREKKTISKMMHMINEQDKKILPSHSHITPSDHGF